jgi:hypothetical protein
VKLTVLPDPPINLMRNNLLTSPSKITFSWEQGASDGGYPIIDYQVSTDYANGTWTIVADKNVAKNFTLTSV